MKFKILVLVILFNGCIESSRELEKTHKELGDEFKYNNNYVNALNEYKLVDTTDEDYKMVEIDIRNLEATVYFKSILPDSIFASLNSNWFGVGNSPRSYPGPQAHLFSNIYNSKRQYLGQIISRKRALRGNNLCLLLEELDGNKYLLPESELNKGILYTNEKFQGENEYDEAETESAVNPDKLFDGAKLRKVSSFK